MSPDELDQQLFDLAIAFRAKHGAGNIVQMFKTSLYQTGRFRFNSIRAAANFIGVPKSTMCDWISNKRNAINLNKGGSCENFKQAR